MEKNTASACRPAVDCQIAEGHCPKEGQIEGETGGANGVEETANGGQKTEKAADKGAGKSHRA